jgi:hypothetical protein
MLSSPMAGTGDAAGTRHAVAVPGGPPVGQPLAVVQAAGHVPIHWMLVGARKTHTPSLQTPEPLHAKVADSYRQLCASIAHVASVVESAQDRPTALQTVTLHVQAAAPAVPVQLWFALGHAVGVVDS